MFKRLDNFLSKCVEIANVLARCSCLLLVIVTVQQVFQRYINNEASVAVQEFEWWLFSVIFWFGAAATFRDNNHVRVDLLYQNLNPKKRMLVDILGNLVFVLPTCCCLIFFGYEYLRQAFQVQAGGFGTDSSGSIVWEILQLGERSPDPGGLPAWWLIKTLIPLGGLLIVLQSIREVRRLVSCLRELSVGNSHERRN